VSKYRHLTFLRLLTYLKRQSENYEYIYSDHNSKLQIQNNNIVQRSGEETINTPHKNIDSYVYRQAGKFLSLSYICVSETVKTSINELRKYYMGWVCSMQERDKKCILA
jgi:23S rRNA maturation mini-RNase III